MRGSTGIQKITCDCEAMPLDDIALSKTIAHALRHAPWVYELELYDEGWVFLDSLVAALREKGGAWSELSRRHIEAMMATADKQRYELEGNRIRAVYGHSLPGRLARVPAAPPAMLYHGTPPRAAARILKEDLKPMGRQYAHLSVDRETAQQVGRRRAPAPVILQVASAAAHDAGVVFYAGNDKVWLADSVPAEFLEAT